MSGGNLDRVLRLMAEKKASDVFLSARTPILIKINGQIMQLTDQVLTPSQPRQLLAEMVTPTQPSSASALSSNAARWQRCSATSRPTSPRSTR